MQIIKKLEEPHRRYCWQIVQWYSLGFKSTQIVEFGGTYLLFIPIFVIVAMQGETSM